MRSIVGLFLALGVVWAQDASFQGRVSDPSGAPIANAKITITNVATGVLVARTSNESGLYAAPLLNPGVYRMECEASGFATRTFENVRLETGQTARLDFDMRLGTVAETIEVTASAVLINSETTVVGQVIDNKRILEMPLNGRNYLQLAQFTVGVLPGGLNAGARGREEGAFAAVGMQIAQNNVLLDGNDNSSRTSGGPLGFEAQAVKPPVDAVSEFKVVTNNMSAEYGFRAGAKVLVTTRSGTNEFHGSAYEFLRNDKFDGTNFFANRSGAPKPSYRQNQYGGTLGGPIIPNRTFFFSSFQGTNIRLGRSYIQSVPSRDIVERADFSQQPAVRRNIFDPQTLSGSGAQAARLPFAGNVVPSSRFDPVSRTMIGLYPTSNIPGRDNLPDNYFFSPSDADNAYQYDFRVDHNLTDSHRLFARYSIRDQFRNEPGVLPFPATGGLGQTIDLLAHNITASLSSTLSPRAFNELRFGFSKFDTRFDILDTENLNKVYGILNAPGDTFGDGLDHGSARFTPGGFAEVGSRSFWPNINNLANYMLTNTTLLQRGRHTIKFGGEGRRINIFRDASRFRRGQFSFDGRFTSQFPNQGASRGNTGNSMADFFLGWANNAQWGNNQGENAQMPYFGFFVQDDWKVNNRLTLNIGLRYEVFVGALYPDPDKQRISRYLLEGVNVSRREDEKFTFPTDGGDCGCNNDWNNFAPRLGLAFSVDSRTVIRAGGGIFYGEPNNVGEGGRFVPGAPRSSELTRPQGFEQTDLFVRQGVPDLPVGIVPPGTNIAVASDFLPNFYAGQWFFDIQRQLPLDTLLTIGYNGTAGTHLSGGRNINLPETPSTVAANQRLKRREFNNITLQENALNSSYNSLTIKAERRFSQGFTFLSSFTWSKNIDQGNEPLLDGSPGIVTPYDLSRERSRSTLDRRRAYVLSTVYELPFGNGKPLLKSGPASWILGGWEIGGIVGLYSGLPVSNSINVNNQNLGGATRGTWVRNPNLPNGERTIDRWFDTSFAVPTPAGEVGNVGRNVIDGPGRRNLDLLVARNFRMPWEGHALQFRAEAFNATNTANFGAPNAALGTPNQGRIIQAEEPRRIQFSLKYYF
ncbi:MAG: carboxypeptidase regulatory-like domain-containing protein [Bryobacteraceae bacterium]